MKHLMVAVLAVVFFSACSSSERYAANQAATDQWLSAAAGTPQTRVTGAWEALEYGWGGAGRFEQSGNKIVGALGNYQVRGVVNGHTVYLAFESSGWTYYTAMLVRRGDTLGGFYSSNVPFSTRDGSLTLRRIGD